MPFCSILQRFPPRTDTLLVFLSRLFRYLCEEDRLPFSECWQTRMKYNTGFVIRKKKTLALCSSYHILVNVVLLSGAHGFGYCLLVALKCSVSVQFSTLTPAGGRVYSFQIRSHSSRKKKVVLLMQTFTDSLNLSTAFQRVTQFSPQTETKVLTCCKWKRKPCLFYGQTTCCILSK